MNFFLETSIIVALPTFFVANEASKKAWAQIAFLQEQFLEKKGSEKKGTILGCISLCTV